MSDTCTETCSAVSTLKIEVLIYLSLSKQHDQRCVNSDCPHRLSSVFVLRLLPRPDSSAEIYILVNAYSVDVYSVNVYSWNQCHAYRNVIVARRHQSVCR